MQGAIFLNYAIVCAEGIGDALLMMIVAHHLHLQSHRVTLFHKSPTLIQPLFPWAKLLPYPEENDYLKTLEPFDHVIVQNDHSPRAFLLHELRTSSRLSSCIFFLITPSKLYRSLDFLFDPCLSLVENILKALTTCLSIKNPSPHNGISIPLPKTNTRNRARVILHPTSSDPKRNWRKEQFLQLAKHLKKQGFQPVFVMTAQEKQTWISKDLEDIAIICSDNLIDCANLLVSSGFFIGNDSGIGHLASNLGIPTLTISGNPKRVKRWRPSFTLGDIVTIPCDLPNFKGLVFRYFDGRFRDKYWHYFLPVGKVLKRFNHLVETTYNQKDLS